MSEYDFKLYIIEDAETGQPLITMEFAGLDTMEEAEDLANQLFAIISGKEEQPKELH